MKTTFLSSITLIFLVLFSAQCKNDPVEVADKRDNIADKSWFCDRSDGSSFAIMILKDNTDKSKLHLTNFANNTDTAYATISQLTLTVPEQKVGNFTISASGVISDDYQSITWDMIIDDENFTAKCTPGGITK